LVKGKALSLVARQDFEHAVQGAFARQ
jgi:hypothetical protein